MVPDDGRSDDTLTDAGPADEPADDSVGDTIAYTRPVIETTPSPSGLAASCPRSAATNNVVPDRKSVDAPPACGGPGSAWTSVRPYFLAATAPRALLPPIHRRSAAGGALILPPAPFPAATTRLSLSNLVHVVATVLEGVTPADARALPWHPTASIATYIAWAGWHEQGARAADAATRAIRACAAADAAAATAARAPSPSAADAAEAAHRAADAAGAAASASSAAIAGGSPEAVVPTPWLAAYPFPVPYWASCFYPSTPPQAATTCGGLIDVRAELAALVAGGRVPPRAVLAGLLLARRASAVTGAAVLSGWTIGRLLPAAVTLAAFDGRTLAAADVAGVGGMADALDAAGVAWALRELLGGHVAVGAAEVAALEWLLVDRYTVLTGAPPPR